MLTQPRVDVDYAIGVRSLEREVDPVALAVEGELPPWLTGTLVRTGPARFEVGERSLAHWFDGLAMLHRFAFGGGEVTYSNRFLRSRAFRHAETSGDIGYPEFATDPCRSLFGRAQAAFSPKLSDNGSVNVVRLGDETLALTETPLPVAFDRRTLDTAGVTGWAEDIPGHLTIAHPHHDRQTGELLSYATQLGPRSRYRLYAVRPGGAVRVLADVPVDRPAYMHSFALTDRYAVLAEWPFTVNPLRLALSGRPFIENYRWEPERGTRYTVIDRRDGRVRARVQGPATFAFHHVNACERGGELLLDASTYDDPSVIDLLYLDRIRSGAGLPPATLRRHRVPLGGGDATVEQLAEPSFELGRIDYARRNGRAYRYAWGASNRDGWWLDALVKLDVTGGEAPRWWSERRCYPGEPVFVSDGQPESGVLLSIVLDSERETSFLLVLDAGTLGELARAEVPHAIPFHFHGDYIREAQR
ncbi:MAG TPA: carotenoid oxygenase family protein [Solirubrobacteraceae bacterium]|jgi:carotenoid cleavage dioxygenase-like enzyme|nr:carotenoid oxygenase family protein [Solirubrobacteraceae bacterium]